MRGFTLLEVLISIALLAIITTLIYSTFTSNVAAVQIAREKSISNQTARIILDRMTKELESAFVKEKSESQNISLGLIFTNREIDGKPADSIHFTTLSGVQVDEDSPFADLCEVGYSVEAGDEDKDLILTRRQDNTPDDDIASGGSTYEMADNITGFDISFADNNGNEYDEWDMTSEENQASLPALITIRLVIKEKTGNENIYTTSVHPILSRMK